VFQVDELPRSMVGKVLRRKVVEQLTARLESDPSAGSSS
jgi:acyl-CoA synthetase (AMP-forming)/AMP-acid ligase II